MSIMSSIIQQRAQKNDGKQVKAGLMGKESDEEASLSASFHLFFFISKLTSTRKAIGGGEERGGARKPTPACKSNYLFFSFSHSLENKKNFSCVLEPTPYVAIPRLYCEAGK